MKCFKSIIYTILFVIIVAFNVHIRLYPAYFPQFKKIAEHKVESQTRSEIAKLVEDKYPQYNPLIKQKISKELLTNKLQNKTDYNERLVKELDSIKDKYQDDQGNTYFQELDPYHWMRYTKLVLKNGYPGDYKKDGLAKDEYMLAPKGVHTISNQFLFYSSAYMYKLFNNVFPQLSVERFLFYLPVFWFVILLLIVFLFCIKYFSPAVGLLASFMIGAAPVVLNRSAAGWYDMDMLSLIFPMIIIWTLSTAVKSRMLFLIILSTMAAVFVSLFAYTWVGWWFVVAICLGALGYHVLNALSLYSDDKKKLRNNIIPYCVSIFVFVVTAFVLVLIVARYNPLVAVSRMLVKAVGLGTSAEVAIWPNTLFTVGELRKADFVSILKLMHGALFFVVSIFSMLYVYCKEKRSEKSDAVVSLVLWSLLMSYASTKGIRFVLFLIVPFSIFFSAGVVELTKFIFTYLDQHKNKIIRLSILLGFGLSVGFAGSIIVDNAKRSAENLRPLITDDWYNTLVEIKEQTPQYSIINSWWDFGDWFKEIADRKVLFDGQSQDNPVAYWMARVLYSSNPLEVKNILRMLNNSSYDLFNDLKPILRGEFTTIALLDKLVNVSARDAELLLDVYKLSPAIKNKIMDTIFYKEPANAYFIVDKTMFPKTNAISFIANWDFIKLYLFRNRNKSKEELFFEVSNIFGIDQVQIQAIYDEIILVATTNESNEVISKRYSFARSEAKGKEEDDIVLFENGIVFNKETQDINIFKINQGYKKPAFAYVFSGGEITNYDFKPDLEEGSSAEEPLSGGLLLVDRGDQQWECIGISDKKLANSLLVNLYFMNGLGYDMFEAFISKEDAGIYVYKINWNN